MNVRRLTAAVCAVLLTVSLLLTACGQETPVTPAGTESAVSGEAPAAAPKDIREIAAALNAECSFSESLSENDGYLAKMFPQLDGAFTDCVAYVPAGIVPEEIFVFKAASEDDAEKIASVLKDYAAQQTDDYSDYAPAQVPKLSDYVLSWANDLVVYVVSCDNDSAAKTAAELLK